MKLSLAAFARKVKQIPDDKHEYKDVDYDHNFRDSNKMTFRPVKGAKNLQPENRLATFGEMQQSGMDSSANFDHKHEGLRFSNFYDNVAIYPRISNDSTPIVYETNESFNPDTSKDQIYITMNEKEPSIPKQEN